MIYRIIGQFGDQVLCKTIFKTSTRAITAVWTSTLATISRTRITSLNPTFKTNPLNFFSVLFRTIHSRATSTILILRVPFQRKGKLSVSIPFICGSPHARLTTHNSPLSTPHCQRQKDILQRRLHSDELNPLRSAGP